MKNLIHISTLTLSSLFIIELNAQNVITPYLDLQGPLYARENIYTLNKTGSSWLPWATRNTSLLETKIDLSNILSLNINGGNLGIGISNPSAKLHVSGSGSNINGGNNKIISGDIVIQSNTGGRSITQGAQLEFVIPANTDGSNLWGQGSIVTVAGNTDSGSATGKMILGTRRHFNKLGTGAEWYYGDDLTIDGSGNIGMGTTSPSAKLHVIGSGSNINGGNSKIISGDVVIQSNTGGRSITQGAQLEFVIPANTDGSSLWGQGSIVTVAGNTDSGSATGKMILGTRRHFNKLGTGAEWYYGDDLTIDGFGYVGIGTTNPTEKLTVKGTVYSTEVKVDLAAGTGPDYVFEPDYNLPTLTEIETYIKANKHLPEVPSAKEMEANGINLSEMNMLLLKKVEELTLHLIEQQKQDQKHIELIRKLQEEIKSVKHE